MPIIIRQSNKDIDEKNEALDKLDENNQIKPQTFLQTSNSEHLESDQRLLSSKSLKNVIKDFIDALPPPTNTTTEDASRTIKNISEKEIELIKSAGQKPNAGAISTHKNTETQKALRHFYPISEKDASMLNFKANREFSSNFVNQLLLKLYIKYPEKRFKNKFTFSDYMIKALKKEKHQGPFVNNPSFRFSCNIDAQEKRILEYEQYLSKVESSSETSQISQVRKKIAGRFSSEISYLILTKASFVESSSGELLTILLPEHLKLSKMQREILTNEVCSVYGDNNCYLDRVNGGFKISEEEVGTGEEQSEATSEPEVGKPRCIAVSSLTEDSVWRQVRQELVLQYGDDIDRAWFSKAVAVECQETSALTLTMPTKFMADWTRNSYGYAISRISGHFGFKYVEYNH